MHTHPTKHTETAHSPQNAVADPSFAINPMDSTEETRLPQCQPVSFSWSGDFVAPVSIVGIIPNGNVIYSSSGKGKEICEFKRGWQSLCCRSQSRGHPSADGAQQAHANSP